jgi:ketosteroid isomerase-like protein
MHAKTKPEPKLTPLEELNVRVAREHFAAESAHDTERTLATLADDIMYHVVASGAIVHGREAVSKYYDVWWTAFPDVTIEVKRLVASGEWVFAENEVTDPPRTLARHPADRQALGAALVRGVPDA